MTKKLFCVCTSNCQPYSKSLSNPVIPSARKDKEASKKGGGGGGGEEGVYRILKMGGYIKKGLVLETDELSTLYTPLQNNIALES